MEVDVKEILANDKELKARFNKAILKQIREDLETAMDDYYDIDSIVRDAVDDAIEEHGEIIKNYAREVVQANMFKDKVMKMIEDSLLERIEDALC